jgi:hypothetical protein
LKEISVTVALIATNRVYVFSRFGYHLLLAELELTGLVLRYKLTDYNRTSNKNIATHQGRSSWAAFDSGASVASSHLKSYR